MVELATRFNLYSKHSCCD